MISIETPGAETPFWGELFHWGAQWSAIGWNFPASHWGIWGNEFLTKIFYPTFLGWLDEELESMFLGWRIIYFQTYFHILFLRIQLFEAGSKFLCVCVFFWVNFTTKTLLPSTNFGSPGASPAARLCPMSAWNLEKSSAGELAVDRCSNINSTRQPRQSNQMRVLKIPFMESQLDFFFGGVSLSQICGGSSKSFWTWLGNQSIFRHLILGHKKTCCFLLRYELRPCPMNAFGVSDDLLSLSKKWASHLSID